MVILIISRDWINILLGMSLVNFEFMTIFIYISEFEHDKFSKKLNSFLLMPIHDAHLKINT